MEELLKAIENQTKLEELSKAISHLRLAANVLTEQGYIVTAESSNKIANLLEYLALD